MFFPSTLSYKMGPRKQITEPKLLILVSFCSEVTSYTDTSHIASTFCGRYAAPFFFSWATLYTRSRVNGVINSVSSFKSKNNNEIFRTENKNIANRVIASVASYSDLYQETTNKQTILDLRCWG